MELLILFPQQMSQHVNQQASNVIINTEQENSDFLTAPSLLMPLLPNRLFKIPHATPIFPSVTHFLQESNLFLSSPDILKAFPAGPAQVSRLQRSLGCSKDWICANFFSTLVSPEQRQTSHIWQQKQQEKDGGITTARDWIKEVGTIRLLRAII